MTHAVIDGGPLQQEMKRRTGNEQELAGSKRPIMDEFLISLSIVGGLLFLLLLKTVTEDRAA